MPLQNETCHVPVGYFLWKLGGLDGDISNMQTLWSQLLMPNTTISFSRVHTLLLRDRRAVRYRPQQHSEACGMGGEQHCAGCSGTSEEGLCVLP